MIRVIRLSLRRLSLQMIDRSLLRCLNVVIRKSTRVLSFTLNLRHGDNLVNPTFFRVLMGHYALNIRRMRVGVIRATNFRLTLRGKASIDLDFRRDTNRLINRSMTITKITTNRTNLRHHLTPTLGMTINHIRMIRTLLRGVVSRPTNFNRVSLAVLRKRTRATGARIFLSIFRIRCSSHIRKQDTLRGPSAAGGSVQDIQVSF